MNSLTLKSTVLLAGTAFFCLGFSVAARAEDSVTFTGGYTTVFSNSDGASETGNYSADTGGKPSPSGITCDSHSDATTTNEAWDTQACQTPNFMVANLGETLFDNADGSFKYAEVAALGSMMFGGISTYGAPSDITQPEFASAIWNVTNPGNTDGLDANSAALVGAVETGFSGNSNAVGNRWILTPNPHLGFGFNPQKVNIRYLKVSEGGNPMLYILLAMLSLFGALFVGRRRARTAQ